MEVEASLSHEWGRAGTTSIGIEMRQEGIVSNVLGKDLDKPIDVWGQSRGQYLKGISAPMEAHMSSMVAGGADGHGMEGSDQYQ